MLGQMGVTTTTLSPGESTICMAIISAETPEEVTAIRDPGSEMPCSREE
jgi:hypothetical protein